MRPPKVFGEPGMEELISDIKRTSDGGYILAGLTGTNPRLSTQTGAAYLVKLDEATNILWQKSYPLGFKFAAVQEREEGGYIAAGSAFTDLWSMYLVETDELGEPRWERLTTTGWPDWLAGRCVHEIDDGYVVGGGSGQFVLQESDPGGNPSWIRAYSRGARAWGPRPD